VVDAAASPSPAPTAPPPLTPEALHDWALAIAEWSDTLAKEAAACSAQARRVCERLMPERYEHVRHDTPAYGTAGRAR
jgi:hypothetical protein